MFAIVATGIFGIVLLAIVYFGTREPHKPGAKH
jgi:hypothetical protein